MTEQEAGRRPQFGMQHRLQLARETADLKQSELAEKVEVARTTISNWESGVSRPSTLQAGAIALACGVDAEWLIDGEDLRRRRASGGVGGRRHLWWLPEEDSNFQPAGIKPSPAGQVIFLDAHRRGFAQGEPA